MVVQLESRQRGFWGDYAKLNLSKRLKAEEKGVTEDETGWMALPSQCTFSWANSGRWWGTRKPGMLQSMGMQSDITWRLNNNNDKLVFEDAELRYLWDIQVVPCGMREVRNTGVHLWNWVRVEIELSHYCSGCSQSHRERERGGGDRDGRVRKMRGKERKKEQKQTQKLQSRPSNSIQSNVMIYQQHFLRTVTLFSSSSILSITTFSNIPMFFIYTPSVSQIFEAT